MTDGLKKIGKYTILEKLGEGGMSRVYKAGLQGPAGFEKLFAIKVLNASAARDPQMVNMFMDEARLGARMVHPNIVPVLDFGEEAGQGYFIAMEYVSGMSLAKVMKRRFKRRQAVFEKAEILYVMQQVLKALDYAHNFRGPDRRKQVVVHRDVTPENILIDEAGTVKLCDFGIAKGSFRSDKTKTGIVKGKIAYIAPEIMKGASATPAADIYSLGVVMFEMLKGERVGSRPLHREAVEALECDDEMKDIVMQATAQEPGQRFASAAAMLGAINALGFDALAAGHSLGKSAVKRRSKAAKSATAVSGTTKKHRDHDKNVIPETGRDSTQKKSGNDHHFTVKLLVVILFLLFAAALLLALFGIELPK